MKKIISILAIFFILIIFVLNYAFGADLNLTENSINSQNTSVTRNSSDTITNPSATITTGNMADSGLSLSNILNIFLIVIGILLILFAIAILLRLKN